MHFLAASSRFICRLWRAPQSERASLTALRFLSARCSSLTLQLVFTVFTVLLCPLALPFLFIVSQPTSAIGGDIEPPAGDISAPIGVYCRQASHWRLGVYDVWVLQGDCEIRQGLVSARAPEGVVWIEQGDPNASAPHKVIAYLDAVEDRGFVTVDFGSGGPQHRATGKRAQSIRDKVWTGRFFTSKQVDVHAETVLPEPDVKPAVYHRGVAERDPHMHSQLNFTRHTSERPTTQRLATERLPLADSPPGAAASGPHAILPPRPLEVSQLPAPPALEEVPLGSPVLAPGASPAAASRSQNVVVRSRGNVRMQVQVFPSADGMESIAVITSGVNILIQGIDQIGRMENIGVIDIETDRLVIWTSRISASDFAGGAFEAGDRPLEFYLEGNIIFRQGDRIIYADRMYYNVRGEFGIILSAEAITPIDNFHGLVRLKADVLQQLNRENFIAHGAAITSSQIGKPRYWLQAETVTFSDRQVPLADPFTGQPIINPQTGEPAVEHELLAASRNNYLYFLGLPVFYWPVMAADLNKPNYYIDQVSIKNDNVFGFQVLTTWDMYHLLGYRDPPEGTLWNLSLDYLSERGPAIGTLYEYNRNGFLGLPGPVAGFTDYWGIYDNGMDNLGADRRHVPFENKLRGRNFGRHRQQITDSLQFTLEQGFISDRNFLEQYYEREWDTFKDEDTSAELKYLVDDTSWNLFGQIRVNDFFTQTEWLPRADHIVLGRSLLSDRLTWYSHTHAGYARLRVASEPENPVDAKKFDLLAWEEEVQGVRAGTRQELDLPVDLGPVKVVPYVLGDVTHYGEDLTGESATRLYGQTGVRASVPIWRSFPEAQSVLMNVNGLAHKVVFTSEFLWAESNVDLETLPLYDPLDDDAQEHFRRRFYFNTFDGVPGGNTPLRFDERFYALRTGMQSHVTAASLDIADDLMLAKVGVQQRLQTKRGPPGAERIIDWITLDVEGVFFPNADRDNFGAEVGLLNYDFEWHIGDRFSILSDGFFDVFDDGLRTVSFGGLLTRPGRGNLFLGYRSIDGPFTSNILNSSFNYRMSEKWIASAGATVALNNNGNIGQNAAVTRIGESFLVSLGFHYNRSRDNFGIRLAIEPRFLKTGRLGRVGGLPIPPVGAFGLE